MSIGYFDYDEDINIANFFNSQKVAPLFEDFSNITKFSIIFEHSENQYDTAQRARDNSSIQFILMSRDPAYLLAIKETTNLHRCLYRADNLTQSRIPNFIKTFRETGECRWDFLSPAPWPESVVAVYLACVASNNGVNIDLTEIITESFNAELKTLWESYMPQDQALPEPLQLNELHGILSGLLEKVASNQ